MLKLARMRHAFYFYIISLKRGRGVQSKEVRAVGCTRYQIIGSDFPPKPCNTSVLEKLVAACLGTINTVLFRGGLIEK